MKKAVPSPGAPRARARWFRVAALLLPLGALGLAEITLRLCGWGYPASFFLPSRHNGQTVLVDNPRFGWRFFPPTMARTPQPFLFTARKPPGPVRIFVFGESAAMGDPEPSFGLARQLERILSAGQSNQIVEVISLGMTAIDSEVMLEIARDCRGIESDFWVIYAGNNEVIGPFGAGGRLRPQRLGRGVVRTILALKRTRVWEAIEALSRLGKEAPEWKGMETFLALQLSQSDPRLEPIYKNFALNLAEVAELGRRSGAKVILATMPVNLKDCPPFVSRPPAGLAPADQAAWDAAFTQGTRSETAGRFEEALTDFQRASKIDAHHAELVFQRARCELAVGQKAKALADFGLAKDLDTLRFRADSRLNRIIRDTAATQHLVLVDTEAQCARESIAGAPGDDLFVDHVHLNFHGNFVVANLLAQQVRELLGGSKVQASTDLMPEAEVARRLAYTDFDRRRIAMEMRARLRLPPFNQQSNFQSRDEHLTGLIEGSQTAPREFAPAYEAALGLATNDWVLHANFAGLLEAAGDSPVALLQWEAVTRLVPQYPDAWLSLGSAATQARRYSEAEGFYEKALKLHADPMKVWNEFGLLAAATGRHADAQRFFRQALRFRPGASAPRVNLAAELADAGDIPGATAQYREAIRRDDTSIAARDNLGMLLSRQGETREAVKLFEQALRLDPTHAQTHLDLARLLARQGQHPEALAHFEAALRARPDFAQAQLGFGLELAQLGRVSEAMPRFAEAARLAPNWIDARFNYGICLANARRFAEAITEFEATLKLDPTDKSARSALERARELAGRRTAP